MSKAGVTHDMVDKYVPSEAEKVEWEKDRDRFIELTLGPLGNDGFRTVGTDFPKRD